MADIETPVQVGFAEFIARLMSEVFDSIITSQVDQEERYAQLYATVALDEQAYARQYIDPADVAAEVSVLFPSRKQDKDNTSAIYEGSPYFPGREDQTESPPVMAVIGLQLAEETLVKEGKNFFLAPSAVAAVHGQVQVQMATKHLEIARQIISRGLPRVVVDSGRVNGKLTFHLTESSPGQPAESAAAEPIAAAEKTGESPMERIYATADSAKSVFALPRVRILPNVKLLVKQADDTSPQSSQVNANVYGEVEITFKTIT